MREGDVRDMHSFVKSCLNDYHQLYSPISTIINQLSSMDKPKTCNASVEELNLNIKKMVGFFTCQLFMKMFSLFGDHRLRREAGEPEVTARGRTIL